MLSGLFLLYEKFITIFDLREKETRKLIQMHRLFNMQKEMQQLILVHLDCLQKKRGLFTVAFNDITPK